MLIIKMACFWTFYFIWKVIILDRDTFNWGFIDSVEGPFSPVSDSTSLADPHGGQAAHVPVLPQVFFPEGLPEAARAHPHGGEALRVSWVQQGLHPQGGPHGPHAVPLRLQGICVRPLPPHLQAEVRAEVSQTKSALGLWEVTWQHQINCPLIINSPYLLNFLIYLKI